MHYTQNTLTSGVWHRVLKQVAGIFHTIKIKNFFENFKYFSKALTNALEQA